MAASAVTLALWDHIVTFRYEFEVIWFRSFDLAKLVYLLNRWGVGAGLVYAAYGDHLQPLTYLDDR